MTSLKDQWQVFRKERQGEATARRQAVHSTLISIGTQRQGRAMQLHSDLDAFRNQLAENNDVRREAEAAFKAQLQQFRLHLHQETHAFLGSTREVRQQRAKQLLDQLDAFVAMLQQDTQQFLLSTHNQRLLMAQQLMQNLQAAHQELTQAIASLRRDNQAALQELMALVKQMQAATQAELMAHQQQRLANQIKLTQDLVAFMSSLQTAVQNYRGELAQLSQLRTQRLQDFLHQSHVQRDAAMTQLFEHLANFRRELQQYHLSLQHYVWGQAQPETAPTAAEQRMAPAVTNGHRPLSSPIAAKPAAYKSKPAKSKSKPMVQAATAVLEPASALESLASLSQSGPGADLSPIPTEPFVDQS